MLGSTVQWHIQNGKVDFTMESTWILSSVFLCCEVFIVCPSYCDFICGSFGWPWCCSASTTDPEWHNDGFCLPCHYATAATSGMMPSKFMPIMTGPPKVCFLFLSWDSQKFLLLVSVTVFIFCFQVLMLLPFSSVRAQSFQDCTIAAL